MGNIHDFSPDEDSTPIDKMELFDRWILEKCSRIGKRILNAYKNYEYHIVFHAVYNFFTVELSSFYLDVIKDRLYCSARDSVLRKSAQTALFNLLKTTLVLMAPILPFTTEEAWELIPDFKDKDESIHLGLFPSFPQIWLGSDAFQDWKDLGIIREDVLKELELAREKKLIGNSLEAGVKLKVPTTQKNLIEKYEKELPSLFIVSTVEIEVHDGDIMEVEVSKAKGQKCQRCWNFSTYVGKSSKYPYFCRRCEEVVKKLDL